MWTVFAPLLAVAALAAPPPPKVADERVVLQTACGDIVLAFYPDVAPKHVAQVLKLAKLGAYDTDHFHRAEQGFVLQIDVAQARREPLTDEQRKAIVKIPLEPSTTLKHRRGILSMARPDEDEDGAETSFSILVGDAPHLDGKYTIFGHVESGMDVVDELFKAPREGTRPTLRLEVAKAVVRTAAELRQNPPAKARPFPAPKE